MTALVRSTLVLFTFGLLISGCQESSSEFSEPNDFTPYISGFTSGVINSDSRIMIRLTEAVTPQPELEQPIKESLFTFEPTIDGQAIWLDDQTVSFSPAEKLPSGTAYSCEFHLNKIVEVPSEYESFKFGFRTITQHLDVEVQEVQAYSNTDLEWQFIEGLVRTEDLANNQQLENVLEVKQDGKLLPVVWRHEANHMYHHFKIDSVQRTAETEKVVIQWKGAPIGSQDTGALTKEIAPLGEFNLVDIAVNQHPEQCLIIQFSDPLLPNQNLDGLITIEQIKDVNVLIEGNVIRVYPNKKLSGEQLVEIHSGIKNVIGHKLKKGTTSTVQFEATKPRVELLVNKSILPSSNGLSIPFKAVSLKAVDVKVIKVFEKNVHQFLQVNELYGSQQMRRVGRVIRKKTVYLNNDPKMDLRNWQTFQLDLTDLISPEKGAIYRIEVGFRKSHSIFECETDEDILQEEDWDSFEDAQDDVIHEYRYYDDYYWDDYWDYEYDWKERDNPCHDMYYRNQGLASINVLASDIGLIAKEGSNGSWNFFATNLLTAKPLPGTELSVFNYQNQLLAKVTCDDEGKAALKKMDGQAFLLVAAKNKERGYLKLNRGTALSMSKFDISGERIQNGLKGFIYGDRGVWRPGDTLFLGFQLEDVANTLPANHPVTLELRDPQGKLAHKITQNKGKDGVYVFEVATDSEAPTGYWRAKVSVGASYFGKRLRIETIKPNRLKVKMDFGKEHISVADSLLQGALQVNWLHGAPGRNLKARIGVTFHTVRTYFDKYPAYQFDDPIRRYVAEEKIIFDGHVNNEGKAPLNLALDFSRKPAGKLMAYFDSKVFEEGGEFSIDHFQMPYAPYSAFVGIALDEDKRHQRTLETDKNHRFDVVVVDPSGNPLARRKLNYKVYKMSWRWWWERNRDDLSNFVGGQGALPVDEGNLETDSKGQGSFNFKVNYPEWGRYFIRVEDPESGHATGQITYVDWPGWANISSRNTQDGAQMLIFNSDKDNYQVGESCTLTFPSSKGSKALLTIETGDEVLEAHWIDTQEGNTKFSFEIQEGMAPNVFANLTLLQPHSQTANDAPIRLYGVIPIDIEDPDTKLHPNIKMPAELAPEESFTVEVSEKNQRGMTYTIAIVDEGLLDLTRFQTPNPHSHFYAKEALGVITWDMFDQVMNAQNGPQGPLLSVGGDGENTQEGKNKANRFKPVVLHLGPFSVEAGESKKHTFTMPNYVGSVRTMVIARSGEAYGHADKTTPVKKPLMVLATLPRVVGPEEEVVLPVTVFAMDPKIKEVQVTVSHNQLFETISASTQSLKFNGTGDQILPFKLKVSDRNGIGKVEVLAKSGSESAHFDFEIDVRNPNPYSTKADLKILERMEEFSEIIDLIGMEGSNSMSLEISSIPPINLEERLSYLLGYPHGCVEQTASKAFPQIYLEDLAQLSEQQRMRAKINIREAIQRMKYFQQSNGGFSYWPGRRSCNDWGTSYVGHFLLEAEAKGYDLPQGMKANWINYQKEIARNWRRPRSSSGYRHSYEDLMQAYRLYTLALANSPDLASMNRLREQSRLSEPCKWKLAAAYVLAGQSEVAEDLIKGLSTHVTPYRSLTGHYGSNWRDMAIILETLTLMDRRDEAALVLRDVAEQLASGRWMSTQSTAYSLVAIAHFLGEQEKGPLECTVNWNGAEESLLTNLPIYLKELKANKVLGNKLEIKNTGKKLIYARWVNRGQPLHGKEESYANELDLDISYLSTSGEVIDVSRMPQGTDFIAKVTVHNKSPRGALHELALTQIFPSGWEIINQRLSGTPSVNFNSDQSDYQDIRDDRVMTYFNLNSAGKRVYYVRLNAAYLGKYYLPAIGVEAMYDASISAVEKGRWVEVVRTGE